MKSVSELSAAVGPVRPDVWRIRNLTLEPARLRALRPGRPLRQLTVDGTLHHTGDVHLPLLLQVQLRDK